MSVAVPALLGNQRLAVAPEETVWLSASAGTGKTQVLSSRVLRLLLQPHVTPSQILCLTFTKAGATEMAARINATLAEWVRLPDTELFRRLEAIGAPTGPEVRARARTLFAAVLDCPGGGLRIDTIHAFAQWLLGAFPEEAELTPGTRPMEDRDRALLARRVLAELLVGAEERGDTRLTDAVAKLSLRMAPDEVERYLLRCAEGREAWFGTGSWVPPLRPRVNTLLGLEADADEAGLHDLCGDGSFDCAALRQCLRAYQQWATKTGREAAEAITAWLEGAVPLRVDTLDTLVRVLFSQKGEPKNLTAMAKIDAGYAEAIARVGACIDKVRERRTLLELAEWLTPALELGRAFALAWDEAKTREGLIDFDDQIRRAADLLSRSDMAEWIRYKLDRRFDHILIDEAQDTNAAQWRIIDALTGDFFAGAGAHGDKLRTLFVVGDYKQAIFRFQGTSPENFRSARERVKALMLGAAENALALRGGPSARALLELGLERSFRTAQPVLDFVDRAIGHIGHGGFGLDQAPEPHVGEERPGYVALWKPVGQRENGDDADEPAEEGEEGWLSRPDRDLAERIAGQVRRWIDDGFPLAKGTPRHTGPGDIMVLVRKRKELAGLIVARLHAAGVPVAGVDRLRLGAPLAVKDLVAALRFAAQPLDDLNLAALLGSPLVGWSQEQLLEHGYRPKGAHLWEHLRRSRHPDVAAALDQLGQLLEIADYEPPQVLLEWLLVGPWQGRRKLVARLGREANDPLDELLNAAHAYAASQVPSLVGFLAWFDAGEGELKRESDGASGFVRVMTVHGAKGLQAPIVILADAAGNPDAGRAAALDLAEPAAPGVFDPRQIPLPALRKQERLGRIREAELQAARADGEEHWRLLYVAMTRAEEALFVAGSLGVRETQPAPNSWYAKLAELFTPEQRLEDPIWDWRLEHGAPPPLLVGLAAAAELPPRSSLPAWLTAPLGPEPRPPRPLAPSALGEDRGADPPLPNAALALAARRGVLIHALLERLPAVEVGERETAAERWLARQAPEIDTSARGELVEEVLRVMVQDDWRELFGADALAEVPIAALVGERVVAGTIDRLLVTPTRVRLIDFKTARRPPASLAAVPLANVRQLAAYAAALAAVYPGRAIEAALLYTHAPLLIELPPELLARHNPAQNPPLSGGEESFAP
ncbi:MAG: double-strand break repair helicase AddA [Novosphingobium sp.]|nr:double-strand break repair helicase AddA [Novosphingobium sp.]